MIHQNILRQIAERYHLALPDEIRAYLKGLGITATLIEEQRLGWNGERITIPIFGREREVLGFRYATGPDDGSEIPDMLTDIQLGPELYGWERLRRPPRRIVICDGEFDRLVLEAHGFPAVTSTAGGQTFLEEWLPYFAPMKHVYVCFRRDLAGAAAAKKVQRLLPRARIATLPPEVGTGGTVRDFFALGRTKLDFEVVLAGATSEAGDELTDRPPDIREFRPQHESVRRRAEGVRRAVRLHDVAAEYVGLEACGGRLVGHCPFHDGREATFSVYPQTDTYWCPDCGAEGDVVKFMTDKKSITVGQALEALERFRFTHELYHAS